MTTFTVTGTTPDTVSKTLVEGNTGTSPPSDDTGTINAGASLNVASGVAVNLNLAAAPVGAGVILTNKGTLNSANGRTVDTGSTAIATGAKLTINNSGTISNAGGASGNDDAIRINNDMLSGTFLLYNTGTISTAGAVNDSVAVRLGKVYSASNISINNGIDAGGTINTSATISTADADAIRPGGVNPSNSTTAFGSSTVTNYGTISAQYQTGSGAAQLSKVNAIDIGGGQSTTVLNHGTIVGDESGLGSDNASGGAGFAANYNVTNFAGSTITGNNGAAIAVGTSTINGTATINNQGTISGNASGVGRTTTSGVAPTVSISNGTGIYVSTAATIVNGSATNSAALIQGNGVRGTTSTQGGATYYAINVGSGSITNYGVISEKTATGAGAAINVTGSTASTVTNYGTITGAGTAAIAMGGGADTINLYTGGTITGTIDGGAGADTLNLGLNTAQGAATSGTLNGVVNVEILNVNGGTWTITDAESYGSGVTIASGATLVIGPNGSTNATIVDNGTLTYTETGTFTKSQPITGTGKLVQAGTGALVLSNGGNTYSGGTSLQSGALDVTTIGAAGSGPITFAAGAQTLDIEQAALNGNGSFADTLASFGPEDTIDLRGIGAATGASFDASTSKLTVTGGTEAVTLQLDAAGMPAAGTAYGVTSDGNGGTLVAIDQIATIRSVTSSPSSGYVKAGQTITLTITTSKAVTISGNPPVLNLQGGGTAIYDAANSTATSLVFKDTVASGQDASGVVITSVTNASSVQDATHVPVNFGGAINQASIGPSIDTTAPAVAITSAAGLTNRATQTISGTVDGGTTADDGTTVGVYETFNGTTNLLGTATVANGTWSTTVSLSSGNGNHTIYATDTDTAGNTGTSASVTYDLETTAPPVTVTGAGGLTNKPMQTITGTVDVTTDPEAVGTTVTATDITKGTTLGTGTVASDGSFAVNVTLSGEGTHSIQVGDTDKAGNSGFANITYNLDTTAPAQPSLALASDTGVSGTDKITSNPTITYTASATGDTLLYKAENSTTYTTTAPVYATDGSQDGLLTVYVEEQDAAGNISTVASLTFTLDTTPPTTAPTLALANDTGASSSDRITSDPTINATAGTSGDTLLYRAADGTYSTTAPTFTADGTYTVTAAEEDAAGNIGPAASLTFTLDRTPPSAPSLSLANDTGASGSDKITNDSTIASAPSAAGDTLLYKLGNGAYSSTAPTITTDGTYTLSAEEVDRAGNVGPAASLTFTLDTTPPDIDLTSIGGNTNKATQIVNGMVGVVDAGTTVSIFEDGGTTAVATAVVSASGYFSASVNLGADGAHTLTASDTDKAGNVGTTDESLTYNVDSTAPTFTAGNLVISISGNGDGSGDYGDNQATPLVLQQITTDGTYVSQVVLPQTTTVVNGVTEYAVSAEYGSSSEGSLQLSADGHSLVIAGYGVNAQTYNAGGAAVYGNAALAQSTSIQGGQYTAVQRVVADINANGTIDTSTALYNVFNGNNPRSVATIDGSSFYVSGQGIKGDKTQGLYLVGDGATTATAIDQSTDTRTAVIYNGQLYVSRDSKQGNGGTSNIAVYGSALPTKATSGTILESIDKTALVTSATGNTINGSANGQTVNLDPNNFFFADANTLYVADGGIPKQGGVGDGGLQKWTFDGTKWNLQYTLSAGLNIAAQGADEGTTGLIGLTGKVDADGTVELYATNQTVGDTDQKYVFGITDQLSASTNAGQSFTTLVTAAPDTNIRGIAFAPTPISPTVALAHDTGLSATDHITNDATLTYTKAESRDTLLYKVGAGGYSTTAPSFQTDGTYTVSVEERDPGGNVGTPTSFTFTLDTTADVGGDLAVSFGASNADMSGEVDAANAKAASFTVAGLDADAAATIIFKGTAIGGGAKSVSVIASQNGTGTVDLSGFKDGAITASISATDAAGNAAMGTGASTVLDTTADAGGDLAVSFSASDAATAGEVNAANAGAAAFTVSGLDADATATVTFTGIDANGNVATVTKTETGNGSDTVDLRGFADGTVAATITAKDNAGNDAPGTGTGVTIDTTAPATPAAPMLAAASDSGSSSTDDVTNVTTPTFTGSAEAGSTVTLYDGTTAVGTAVATASGAYAVQASALGDGQHTLTVTATDAAGNVSTASAGTGVTIDTTAPATPAVPMLAAASDSGSSSTDDVTNVTTPTFTGSAEAGSTVTLYDGTTAVGTAVATASGAYAVQASALGDGQHTLTVTATDAAGNVSTASAGTGVTIDTTAPATPAVPMLAAASDSGSSSTDDVTNVTTPTFTGSAEAGSTVTLYDGTTAVGTAVATASGAYAVQASALGDGQHTLTVTATDAAGNVSTASAGTGVTIDTTAPATPAVPMLAAASDSGSSSTDDVTNVTTPTFTGSAEAGSTVTLYDGTTAVGTAVATASGAYAVQASALGDGQHTLTVTATDAAGNVSTASAGTGVTIDTTAPATPAVPMLAAASDSGSSSKDDVTNVTTPTFTGSAEAGSTVTLYDDTTAVGTAVATASGAYAVQASALGDGQHTLTVTATDAAGNVSTASAGTGVTIDTTAPTTPAAPTLAAASDSGSSSTDGITNVTRPTFIGSAEAGSTVTLYDGTNVVGTALAAASGAYSVQSATLANGSHTLTVRATDTAGNASAVSAGRTITIDTVAPGAVGVALADDTGSSGTDRITNNGTITYTPPEAGVTLLYAADGSTTFTATKPNFQTNGTRSVSVEAVDAAGNVGPVSTLSFTLDSKAPATPAAPTLAAASDSGSSSTDGITNVTRPTFIGSAEAGSTVTLYDGTNVVGTALAAASGAYSVQSATLANGSHTLTVRATDTAGNASAVSAGRTITIDTVAPGAVGVALADDTGSSGTDRITNNGTITYTPPEAGVTLLYAADGSTTFTATKPNFQTNGTRSVSVEAVDAAGNVGPVSTLSFTLDSKAPATPAAPMLAAASDSGSSSTDGITNVTRPTFTGTAEAGSTVTLYDGTNVVGTALAAASGAYSVQSATLANGSHTLTVRATDTAGNASAVSAGRTITIDTVAPGAVGVALADDTGSSGTDRITNNGTITYTPPEAGVTLLYAADGSTTFTATKPNFQTNGTRSVSVEAVDAAGNVGPVSTLSFTLDSKAPATPAAPMLAAASDSGSSSTDGITNVTRPTFTGTAEAGSTVTLYDGTNVVGTALAAASGAYSVQSATLANGSHTLTVRATDTAGNASAVSAGRTITIDTVAPGAVGVALADDTGSSGTDRITNNGTITYTPPEAGVTLLYAADGSTTFTATKPNFQTNGTRSVSVEAVDAAGNVGPVSTLSFTLDSKAPVVAIGNKGGTVTTASQTIAGTGEAGTAISVSDNGKTVGTTTVLSNGTWSDTITFHSAGAHSLVASDTDVAGNTGTSKAVAFQYSPASAANMASLHNMVQAMSTMSASSSAAMTPTAAAAPAEHPLAASHG